MLLARLRAEFERAERAEAALAVGRAGGAPAAAEVADGPLEPVHEPIPEPVAPVAAPVEPDPARVEEPMRILLAAERTAEAAVSDARAEAERIRREAESVASTTRSEAETLLARARAEAEAEARRAGEEARRSIEAEVLALREDRDVLSADVTNLRRWLDDQRARLRSTAEELQRLVDDPDALRAVPVPEIAPVDEVAPEAAAEPEPDEVVDARTNGDVLGGFDEPLFDDGEPTQAVPRFGDDDLDGPGSFFDDERAPTGFTSSDVR